MISHLRIDQLIEAVVHHQDAGAGAHDKGGELAAPVGLLRSNCATFGERERLDRANREYTPARLRQRASGPSSSLPITVQGDLDAARESRNNASKRREYHQPPPIVGVRTQHL